MEEIKSLPVPPKLPENKEFLSGVFCQKDRQEVLQISGQAKLPGWLTRKVYHKVK
jgi:hypothetical protein